MFKKTLIALAAAGLMATAAASTASAKTNIDLNIGLGLFGGGGGYVDPYPSYDSGWDDGDCYYKIVTYKKWNAAHTKFWIKKKQVMVCN